MDNLETFDAKSQILTEYEIARLKNLKTAQFLMDCNNNKNLNRLCQLGGFLIRNVDFDWDQQTYKRELQKQKIIYKDECDKIHSFVLNNISDYHRNKYFKQYLINQYN